MNLLVWGVALEALWSREEALDIAGPTLGRNPSREIWAWPWTGTHPSKVNSSRKLQRFCGDKAFMRWWKQATRDLRSTATVCSQHPMGSYLQDTIHQILIGRKGQWLIQVIFNMPEENMGMPESTAFSARRRDQHKGYKSPRANTRQWPVNYRTWLRES